MEKYVLEGGGKYIDKSIFYSVFIEVSWTKTKKNYYNLIAIISSIFQDLHLRE